MGGRIVYYSFNRVRLVASSPTQKKWQKEAKKMGWKSTTNGSLVEYSFISNNRIENNEIIRLFIKQEEAEFLGTF